MRIMAKRKNVVKHFGFRLRVNHENKIGSKFWKTVGFVFASKTEADAYRKKHFPQTKAIIEGVRLNIEPVKVEKGNNYETV